MSTGAGFLAPAEPDAAAEELFDDDVAERGFVMNVSRLWAYDATALDRIFAVARRVAGAAGLSIRHRLLVVLATSAARGSTYCPLAWGSRFPDELPGPTAAAVVRGDVAPPGLDAAETALVHWVRAVATGPTTTTSADVAGLRAAGWTDGQVFAVTVFAALRVAFASVNDALGALPDDELAAVTPPDLVAALPPVVRR
ncbi:carboxymuconolactone decarboxylase family protein [Cellulomonas sp. SLBN-39]|uniref:carboxymuconolactone decarboxylase family protein n=1 Tax=Cellulomonas sp. SLBN-39 TaxID=2768446 RepID=UPI001154B531|nr:hypothetical protein [Cellulomonas sp. SLBN-39]TQL03125.1 putative peroxidase-related enzyme [Cellulomonas sp. SLBN-39]